MSGTNNITTFSYDGHIDTFTAPAAGTYEITAIGAQGGNGSRGGGDGEQVVGDFQLTQGEVLQIAVGGTGSNNAGGGGGGGGSFVVAPGSVALEVAGGGGGGRAWQRRRQCQFQHGRQCWH